MDKEKNPNRQLKNKKKLGHNQKTATIIIE